MTRSSPHVVQDGPQASGQDEPPDGGPVLKPMLHRVDLQTGRFCKLMPEDRQMYLPFYVKVR